MKSGIKPSEKYKIETLLKQADHYLNMQIIHKLNGLHDSLRTLWSTKFDRTLTITDINKVLKLILIVTKFIFQKLIIFTIRSNIFKVSKCPLPPPKPFGKIHSLLFTGTSFFQDLLVPTPVFEIYQKFSSRFPLKKRSRYPLW